VQILDGIAGGIFGVLSVLMVADLTKGSGRFNVTQGMLATSIGIGAGLSNLLAGFVVQKAGYNVGFLMLAALAAVDALDESNTGRARRTQIDHLTSCIDSISQNWVDLYDSLKKKK
jgi:MFS family permease